jgi:hypothetical protein
MKTTSKMSDAGVFKAAFIASYKVRKEIPEELFENVIIRGRPMFENFSEEDLQLFSKQKQRLQTQLMKVKNALKSGICQK